MRNGDHVDGPHPAARIREWHGIGRLPDEILLSRDGLVWHPVRWDREQAPARVNRRRSP